MHARFLIAIEPNCSDLRNNWAAMIPICSTLNTKMCIYNNAFYGDCHLVYSCLRIEAVQGARHETSLHLRCRLHRYASSTTLDFAYSAAVRPSSEYCIHDKYLSRKVYHPKIPSCSRVYSSNLLKKSAHVDSQVNEVVNCRYSMPDLSLCEATVTGHILFQMFAPKRPRFK